ncbi:insulin-like growth factor-binding protein complex acid labile subunit [Strongylocentrotus purpuratus]|uniref:TIR domain-containing protein n=1 Tax=Strongylocentrotus purpuratus TaxID=7668 RepID=A0A7M7P1U9_STRPU|nr:insulin-like growth factor-binding protein complex acid labile subunit [Strongylocentrotus purpuratus]
MANGSILYPLLVACLFVSSSFQSLHRHDGDSAMPFLTLDMDKSFHGCDQYPELKTADCRNKDLDTVPQNLSEDTEVLNLYGNNITKLLNSSFEVYPLINSLVISFNDMRAIEVAAFYPLKGLMYLDLSYNRRLVFPTTGVFVMSSQLSILDLRGSNLKSLPNDTLEWSPHLDSVDLSFNQLTFINVSSCGMVDNVDMTGNRLRHLTARDFAFGCRTDTLDLRDNPIKSVDPDVIASLHVRSLVLGGYPLSYEVLANIILGISRSDIEQLTIEDGSVGAFPKGFFDPLRDSSLSILNIYNNELKNLYPLVFSNLTKLKQLRFNDNRLPIGEIQPDFFDGMNALKVLAINNNRVRQINPQSQTWTMGLSEFDLSGNLFTEISAAVFRGLGNLTFLDLSWNSQLSVVQLTAFTGLDNIQTIDLTLSSLVVLELYAPLLRSLSLNSLGPESLILQPGISFQHLQSLVNLDMEDSKIFQYSLWNTTANASLFDGLFNLKHLDLSKNSFRSLPSGIFRQLSVVQELNLDYCKLTNLHPLVFSGLESLQKLSLNGNYIQHIHDDVLSGLGQIKSISFDENRIEYLEELMFSNNCKLTNLSLASNRLTRLSQSTFKPIFSSILSLDLSMNPINYTCDIKWLIDWLNEPIRLKNKDQTICSSASLQPLREKPLLDFDPNELCIMNYGIFSLIPLASISLIVISVLLYHYRWQLRYKRFLLKLAVLGFTEMRDARDHNDYEFDVNIIFYDDDEEWIRRQLRPAFEERLPQFQRNVFGDEDLVLGMHYLNSVDYVVSHSYKTIVVLSRAAVHDHWFILKFRTAMDHVSDTLTEFVVVVFLEDIPDDEMPFLARLYLSDGRPYIYWTENLRGQEYFWAKFTKNLTINLRTNDLLPNE